MSNRLSEIDKQIHTLRNIIETKRDEHMEKYKGKDNFEKCFTLFDKVGKEELQEMFLLQNEESLLIPINLKKWDGNGDKMTIKEWVSCVNDGGFIDYDGFGYYSVDDKISNKIIYPSDVELFPMRDKEFTHIIWFNR